MTPSIQTNYFVCTLGEAETEKHEYRTVINVIEGKAKTHANFPAVGFYSVRADTPQEPVQQEILTFAQVLQGALATAEALSSSLNKTTSGQAVGLLSSSSPGLFFSWLACICLGHPVLLIAPECTASGIASLCNSCKISTLLTDEDHISLGRQAVEQSRALEKRAFTAIQLPFDGADILANARSERQYSLSDLEIGETDIAYLHHTSGTSSGTPKPIPQTHRGVVGALPSLDGQSEATFTTTPMFHGGPADTLRAWTSSAMIWLFPSHRLPITATNVMKCLACAEESWKTGRSPRVSYFGSVPYILQMMGATEEGMEWLKKMDLVGVGGAALPKQIGNELVDRGVRLVSRFGSAECGFLLSSHRDYDEDREWQYLRLRQGSGLSQLRFEARDEGLAELVVPSVWPQMAKRNCEDGSYATSDLFEQHSDIENAWRYHSRADSQLTLVTGKKFDPAPMEASLVAASDLLDDVLVFGNDRPYPGALLFRSKHASDVRHEELLHHIAPIISKMNTDTQSHARISRRMLVPMPHAESPLPKSSKGTILRGKAELTYAEHISNSYEEAQEGLEYRYSDEDLPGAIGKIVIEILPNISDLGNSDDLFSSGVDSIGGMQIRSRLRQFLPKGAPQLPINIIEICPTIDLLANHIVAVRQGKWDGNVAPEDGAAAMWDLVDKYGTFAAHIDRNGAAATGSSSSDRSSEVVLLTGATGALGAHVLDELRRDPSVSKIYCLVRGAAAYATHERVAKALEQRQLSPLDSTLDDSKITVLQATFSDPRLGLADEIYSMLASEVTTIMHLAWSVNFRMQLRSFEKDSIAGIRHLFDLALSSPRGECAKFLYCSSVASVSGYQSAVIPEELIQDPGAASRLGYSQSKWVAEQICHRAHRDTRLKGRVGIFRFGQLSGDSKRGIWNSKEAWPLMLSSMGLTGALPDLPGEVLDWLPVDQGAEAMCQGIDKLGKRRSDMLGKEDDGVPVFHVLNDHDSPTWTKLLAWLGTMETFKIVAPGTWVSRLEEAVRQRPNHPSAPLLDHWKRAYSANDDQASAKHVRKRFATDKSKVALPILQEVEPVDEEYFRLLWTWIRKSMAQ